MKTTIKYVFLTAFRDLLFLGIIAAVIAGIFFANFLGSTVMVEKSLMTTAFSAASSRIILVVGMIIFICFHVRKAFENKEIDLILSRPISRQAFIFSYWIGFCAVSAIVMALVLVVAVFFLSFNAQGALLWFLTLFMELMLINAFAVFASVILRSSVSSVLLCFGFYVISRMIGFFNYVLDKNYAVDLLNFDFYAQKVIWFSSLVLPNLNLFAQSDWLLYGFDVGISEFYISLVQTLIYCPLLLAFAIIDFSKKQF